MGRNTITKLHTKMRVCIRAGYASSVFESTEMDYTSETRAAKTKVETRRSRRRRKTRLRNREKTET